MMRSRLMMALVQFRRKDATYYAAAIAFYVLFSLTPFLLLSLSIAALFSKDSGTFLEVFDTWFQSNIPQHAESVRDALMQVFERRGQLGIVGIVWIFISARRLVNAIEIGLDAMLDIEKPKSGVLTTLVSMAFVFLTAILFLAMVLVTVLLDFAAGVRLSFVSSGTLTVAATTLRFVASGAASIALFYGIYRLAPSRGLSNADAIRAGIAATLLWMAARAVFLWFGASQLARYQWLYGSLASFLLLLLWAFVFALSLLMGACMVRKD